MWRATRVSWQSIAASVRLADQANLVTLYKVLDGGALSAAGWVSIL